MTNKFEDILEICLDRITQNGDSIEQCLQSYPEIADQLEPLLRTALTVKDVSDIEPSTEFRQTARSRLLSEIATQSEKKKKERSSFLIWHRGWAIAIALVLVLLVSGGSVVTVSADSLPGDTLYPVKTATEKVQGFFTFGDDAKAKYHMKLAERRAREIELLNDKKRNVPASVINNMQAETDRAINVIDRKNVPKQALVDRLAKITSNQKVELSKMVNNAPPKVQLRLRDAVQRSEKAQNRVEIIKAKLPNVPIKIDQGNSSRSHNSMGSPKNRAK